MKKKILIGLAVLVVLLVIAFLWLNNRNRTLSPPGKTELTVNGLTVSIPYSRPSVRGRVIFGTEAQDALQPYGKYWRLGANESTEITVNKDVLFNGQPVKAGTYKIYAVPGADSFDIALNSELGKWGAMEPDYDLDVLHTKVPIEHLTTPVEQYTISTVEADGGINIIFEFSDIKFVVPIRPQ
jgi:hypothetical protein